MKYPLVYLEWEDAIAASNWHSQEELDEWVDKDNTVIKEVGWIYKENKKYIILISRISLDSYKDKKEPLQSFGQLEKIPKTWIRKRKVLKI